MLAAWLAMTTASTLKDIGEAGARFGFKDDTVRVQTWGIAELCVLGCDPPAGEAPAPRRGQSRYAAKSPPEPLNMDLTM